MVFCQEIVKKYSRHVSSEIKVYSVSKGEVNKSIQKEVKISATNVKNTPCGERIRKVNMTIFNITYYIKYVLS